MTERTRTAIRIPLYIAVIVMGGVLMPHEPILGGIQIIVGSVALGIWVNRLLNRLGME